MAHPNFLIVFAVVLLFTAAESISGPHIADVNILLPPRMTQPVEYRLQGSDGCFKWSWDHHDILSLLPEYNQSSHCSTSARLRSISPYAGRKETAVYASDIRTGIVIRCKVYIDIFSRIQIFHNSVKLDLDGLSTLRVRAFDSEENVFSSLVGLQFKWQLVPESDGLAHHLVHVPLIDSPLSDCGGFCGDLDTQIKLEENEVYSDLFVVKGVGIGREVVSVHLLEPLFGNMEDKIVLTVAEAMSLEPPSPVLVLVGASVQYTLKVIRGGISQVVPLPSPFHRWSALNSSVAQVDAAFGLVQALNLGATSIIVEDTRVAGNVQISSFNVVLPDYISLYLVPLSKSADPIEGVESVLSNARWYVISGRQYLVELKVFSEGPSAREIYLAKNEDVKLYYDEPEHWKNSPVPQNAAVKYGWKYSRILETMSPGVGKLSASLTYSTSHLEGKEVLKVVQEVMVCDQVWLLKDGKRASLGTILLPWSPDVYQETELKATGGCAKTPADYRWLSSDASVISVSATGVVQAKSPGKATVKVMSIFDSLNLDEISVEVSIPSFLVMLPNFAVETVVGSHLIAAVAMKTTNGDYFYQCDAFSASIKWSSGSESFMIVNSTKEEFLKNKPKEVEQYDLDHACAWTFVSAARPGRAILQASFSKHLDHSFGRQIMLKISAPIASFLPIIVRQAGDGSQFGGYWFNSEKAENFNELENLNDLYLAPGTLLDVKLLGGPERWSDEVGFVQAVDVLDKLHAIPKDGVLVHQVQSMHGDVYRILCQELGNFTLVFKRGNLDGDDHPQPVIAEAKVHLACSFPSSIVVLADEPVNKLDAIQTAIQADRGPGHIRSGPITVANGRRIRVSAVGISDTGKAFANSSSLYLRWELNNCDELASWDDADKFGKSTSSWERYLALKNASGLCTVQAMVQSHSSDKRLGYLSLDALTDAIRLQVVSTLEVFPEFALLLFNPQAKLNLSVVGGSCFLDASVNDSRVVEVLQPTSGLQCSQLTLIPKRAGTAVVTVYDVGLSLPLSASSLVEVADVDWIKIMSGDEISLMEGSINTVDLLAGAVDGNTFESSQYAYMNLHVHIEDDAAELVDGNNMLGSGDGYISAARFSIYCKHAGITTLYVTARQQSGQEIYSQIVKVEVYTPPVVHPRDIFLVPGASFVVTVKGGPSIGVVVQYESMNDSAVAVQESSGRVSAMSPGNSTIVATFYGNGHTVLCQAHGKVRVGVPSSAMLNVQSQQLAVGREMHIFPLLLEGDLFSYYELCKNFKWTVENEQVLSFQPAEHVHNDKQKLLFPAHNSYEDEQNVDFIKLLYGRSAGRSIVAITFTCDFLSPGSFSQSRSYSASISLTAVPDPPLALGIPSTWILPPHYTTSDLLPHFSESQRIDGQSQKGTISYSLLRHCGRKDDEVQKDTISIYGNKIKTTDSKDLACILAKDHSTGRIEVASCVRVAEVAQIRIQRRLALHVINLAVGAELELLISYFDHLGNPFREAHDVAAFDIETNYRDILDLGIRSNQNGSIHIKAIRHGRALVMVKSEDNPHKSDYIMVSVGAHVHPQNPLLHPGTHLNFSIEGFNDQASGEWLSDNESIVSVDSSSGEAVARGEGIAAVTFQSSSLKLQTTVKVLKGNIIYVDAPIDTLTNVFYPSGGYSFSVKFSTNDFEAPKRNVEIPYDCKVDPSFVGYAKPWRDLDTGDSYCLFFPYSPEHLARSVFKSMDRRKDISISIHAALRDTNDVSGSASALFIGGFSILDMDKDSLQLNLTPDSNTSIITIVGNTDVGIHWLNRDKLTVRNVLKEGSGIAGRVQYEVKALQAKPFKDKLIFTLPANGQKVELDVTYEPGETKSSTIYMKLWAGVIGCLALLILTVIIFICYLDRPNTSSASIVPSTSSVSAPRTPDRSSPAHDERSPRTPQPFVDYVRRTIDETPYYRREGRRRFDPQNTY